MNTLRMNTLGMNTRRKTSGAVVALLMLAACGSATTKASPATSAAPTTHGATTATISELTKMICEPEAQHDIAGTLGVKTTRALEPTWVAHDYSCRYVYDHGVMRLSVKQLPDDASTNRYVDGLAEQLGKRETLQGLGQGAFTTSNNSVVVRKDDKVLVVDVHGLPAEFGNPPDTRANVAISVAATIMGCWKGE